MSENNKMLIFHAKQKSPGNSHLIYNSHQFRTEECDIRSYMHGVSKVKTVCWM